MIRIVERVACVAGIGLLLGYGAARADGEIGRRVEVSRFDAAAVANRTEWSPARLHAYEMSLSVATGPVLAVLRIPSVNLEVPVYADTSELHLNRGVGLIEHTAAPDDGGNLGIAGHRDGFFRVLGRVQAGDRIEVRTLERRYVYRVAFISLASSSDARLLAQTDESVVTLVTCYPFYFVGHAPQRFVVRGALVSSEPRDS